MAERLSLNGTWLCKGFVGEDWRWRHSHEPESRDSRWWLPATVPGSVHYDLWQNGEIPDPYYERNSLLGEWASARSWVYKRTFAVPASFRGRRLQLHFAGIDYAAQVFLNGVFLGTHEGMFTPVAFDVSDVVDQEGENTLAVVLDPAPVEQPQVGRTSLVRSHKSRMTYWWDFCPRLVHLGIWDNVYLEAVGPIKITDVHVQPRLSADYQEAVVGLAISVAANQGGIVRLESVIRKDSGSEYVLSNEFTLNPGTHSLQQQVTVAHPELWWPNGMGEAALYQASVRVICAGEISDRRDVTFGIRDVQWVHSAGATADALAYTPVVNGRSTYIYGWNWVPMDMLYGVPDEGRLRHLLRLAKEAHVNMLRVWGGGLIERDAFFQLCSEYGIMVWQEFIQSSSGIENTPAADSGFVQYMVDQARQIIPRKRNHASLVLWCGGNELTDAALQPLDDRTPVLGALAAVVRELHPDAHWLPTSPSGPVFNNTLTNIQTFPAGMHDVHGPWEYQGLTAQYQLYNAGTAMLASEFGVEGMTNRRTLDAVVAAENQWPAGKDNPVYFHKGSWWNNEELLQKWFGGLESVSDLLVASQLLQATGLRCAVEAGRRRWPQQSGTLPWQFNEPYPNAFCTSAVDYFGRPKAAYYAVREAYAQRVITAQLESMVWEPGTQFRARCYVQSAAEPVPPGSTVRLRVYAASGTVVSEQQLAVPEAVSAGAVDVGTVLTAVAEIPSPIFFLDLQWFWQGRELAGNRYVLAKGRDLSALQQWAPPQLNAVWDEERQTLTVVNSGSQPALQVCIEDGLPLRTAQWLYMHPNGFHLLPGESRAVAVSSSRGSVTGPLWLQAWRRRMIIEID